MWYEIRSRFAVCIKDSEHNSMMKVKAGPRIATQKLIYLVWSKGVQGSRSGISKRKIK